MRRYAVMFRWTPQMRRWLRNGALVCAATAALITAGLRADLGKSDWAAWVQAIGSIAAIAAAAVTVTWQVGLQRRQQLRAEIERFQLIGSVAFNTRVALFCYFDNVAQAGFLELPAGIRRSLHGLDSMTLSEIIDPGVQAEIGNAIDAFNRFVARYDEVRDWPGASSAIADAATSTKVMEAIQAVESSALFALLRRRSGFREQSIMTRGHTFYPCGFTDQEPPWSWDQTPWKYR